MKNSLKLIICALISLSVGVAMAAPLLIADLNIVPFRERIQGPTANQIVELAYANFTIMNDSTPITQYSGPNIAYSVVLRITNPSNISSQVLDVNFAATSSNTSSSGSLFRSGASGQGYTLEGAMVNDKWYNVTWATALPTINDKGQITSQSNSSESNGYWMQGIQLYDVYVNGAFAYTYMNMNGTWVDVTEKIDITHPQPIDPFSTSGSLGQTIMSKHYAFVDQIPEQAVNADDSSPYNTKYVLAGDGQFDRIWGPGESRLILLTGVYNVRQPFVSASALSALKSGNITVETQVMNVADGLKITNNAVVDTSSVHKEQKQILLTQSGDSYIYNAVLGVGQVFQEDKWGIEVFIK